MSNSSPASRRLATTPGQRLGHVRSKVAKAAQAASASTAYTIRCGEKTYWHAGDGGLYENKGIETLLLLYLKQIQAKRSKRALVIVFDSSYPFSVGERRLGLRSLPFAMLRFDFSRIPSIMEERATTYQSLFRSLQLEGVFPDSRTVRQLLVAAATTLVAERRDMILEFLKPPIGRRPR